MTLIYNFDSFIFESYGKNDMVHKISERLIKIINKNIGKLILNKQITLKSEIKTIESVTFINDIINIKLSDRFYGNVNQGVYFIKNDTIQDLVLNLKLILSKDELSAKILLNNSIFSTIEHEFLHVIENYQTFSNNRALSISWNMDKELKKMQNKYKNSINWTEISYFIYLSLPHEIRARIQQLNKEIEQQHIKGIKDVVDFIKNTKTYKDLDFLSKMDENILLNKLKQDIDYNSIISDFNNYFLKNTHGDFEMNFLKYIKKIKNKNRKILSRLLKCSYNFESFEIEDRIIDYDKYL